MSVLPQSIDISSLHSEIRSILGDQVFAVGIPYQAILAHFGNIFERARTNPPINTDLSVEPPVAGRKGEVRLSVQVSNLEIFLKRGNNKSYFAVEGKIQLVTHVPGNPNLPLTIYDCHLDEIPLKVRAKSPAILEFFSLENKITLNVTRVSDFALNLEIAGFDSKTGEIDYERRIETIIEKSITGDAENTSFLVGWIIKYLSFPQLLKSLDSIKFPKSPTVFYGAQCVIAYSNEVSVTYDECPKREVKLVIGPAPPAPPERHPDSIPDRFHATGNGYFKGTALAVQVPEELLRLIIKHGQENPKTFIDGGIDFFVDWDVKVVMTTTDISLNVKRIGPMGINGDADFRLNGDLNSHLSAGLYVAGPCDSYIRTDGIESGGGGKATFEGVVNWIANLSTRSVRLTSRITSSHIDDLDQSIGGLKAPFDRLIGEVFRPYMNRKMKDNLVGQVVTETINDLVKLDELNVISPEQTYPVSYDFKDSVQGDSVLMVVDLMGG